MLVENENRHYSDKGNHLKRSQFWKQARHIFKGEYLPEKANVLEIELNTSKINDSKEPIDK